MRPAAGSSRQSSTGLRAHGAGDLEAALAAIGQIARQIVGAVDKARLFEPEFRKLNGRTIGAPIGAGIEDSSHREARGPHQRVVLGHHQVLQHRHAGEQTDVLEGARHLGVPGDAEIIHALEQEFGPAGMSEDDAAFGRLVEAGEAVEHRGLAGPVGADERRDVIAAGGERQVADRSEAAKAHGKVLHAEQHVLKGTRHQPCPSATRSTDTAFFSLR